MTLDAAPQPRKRRGKSAQIDPEQVRRLVAEGMSRADIADLHDVSTHAINGICRDYGITGTPGRKPRAPAKPKGTDPGHVPPVPLVPPREAELRATGGRYADLRAWAQRWGVTEVKALQEWHKLGLPIVKVGALFQANGGECTG